MRAVYFEKSIYSKMRDLIHDSYRDGRELEKIVLTEEEAKQLAIETGVRRIDLIGTSINGIPIVIDCFL